MPEVSRFHGISIRFYYREHPPPHFHALAGDAEALIDIPTGGLLEGDLPVAARRQVEQWRRLHLAELLEKNWRRARALEPLAPIAPLS